MELVFIIIISLLTVPLVFFTSNILRVILGLAFMLFTPGYTFLAALFPKKESITIPERLALSFGLSIALVPIVGLILNFSPWGIRLQPLVLSLLFLIFTMSVIALFRRKRLLPDQRFEIKPKFNFSYLPSLWKNQSKLHKALNLLIFFAAFGAIGSIVYFVRTPRIEEKFSEFYVLGTERMAANYPENIVLGKGGDVALGIINHENETINYRVEIFISGAKIKELGPIRISHNDTWEQKITIMPLKTGTKQKIEFFLYKETDSKPYRTLFFWSDVRADRTE